jgi:uridine kinase
VAEKLMDSTSTVLRDVKYRGRDIEGCIKQWFAFVKPNFHNFVEPQRQEADLIVPRGIENTVAISSYLPYLFFCSFV